MEKSESDFRITIDNPYLTLMGELWVSISRIWEKADHVITALRCTHYRDTLIC